jgi:hypothetical protein
MPAEAREKLAAVLAALRQAEYLPEPAAEKVAD